MLNAALLSPAYRILHDADEEDMKSSVGLCALAWVKTGEEFPFSFSLSWPWPSLFFRGDKSGGRRWLLILQHLVHCGDIVAAFQLSCEAANVAYSKAALSCLREFIGLYSPVEICLLYAKMRATARSSLCVLSCHGRVLGCDVVKWNGLSPSKISGLMKVFWCSFDCSPNN